MAGSLLELGPQMGESLKLGLDSVGMGQEDSEHGRADTGELEMRFGDSISQN